MSQVQQYWLPGYGLSRHIVLGHIQYFLGPSATVRPYTYQGRDGYLINGVPLTRVSAPFWHLLSYCPATNRIPQEQINDLAIMSREYERQESLRMTGDILTPSSCRESEPYINEIVPVRTFGCRRQPVDHGGRRGR
ncbi:conserved hypothetical protein [Aspergillus udagawae]|uniref:Uncharacterized protein n=1 Tax=Aspergillus udagawae TaxID=91492 RepID=A0A8H3RRI7_9EURO|nr:conserved hypothetical protein [Aspergillus udagawae]